MDVVSLCSFSCHPISYTVAGAIVWGMGIRCDRAPSPWLLSTYLSNECCSYGERAVGYCQRQYRQTPGGGPEHDLRTFPGIEFGVVTKALENVFVACLGLQPAGDRTSGVSTDRRISYDALSRA